MVRGEQPPPSTPAPLSAKEPKARRNKLRKEEIVAEATRLFAERGYEGTSMGDLAERVGLRKASLFHHFESKDALYATVLSELMVAVQVSIVAAVAAEGSYVDRLDALTASMTDLLGNQPHAARLLMREAMDWGPVMQDRLAAQIQEVLEAAVVFAEGGQREGVFDARLEPRHLVISLIGIYFIPFVIDRTVERFVMMSPYEASFVEARRAAVLAQTRALTLARSAAATQ